MSRRSTEIRSDGSGGPLLASSGQPLSPRNASLHPSLHYPTDSDISARRATHSTENSSPQPPAYSVSGGASGISVRRATPTTGNSSPQAPEYSVSGGDSHISVRRPTPPEGNTGPQPQEHSFPGNISIRRATELADCQDGRTVHPSASDITGRGATDMGMAPSSDASTTVTSTSNFSLYLVEKIRVMFGTNTKMEHNLGLIQEFKYEELEDATQNFTRALGQGGYGAVFMGRLKDGRVVAVKQSKKQESDQQFRTEVEMLSGLSHPNLVNLIGYCIHSDQWLLVYEYMPLGSLEDHLHDRPPDRRPLEWETRMKIAVGVARGLAYLHNDVKPSVIHRDLKPSNILLDEEYRPKLSDFGVAKLGPKGDRTHTSTEVRGTEDFRAPEYVKTGHLTVKSDVYSFGLVLLELISGRKVVDRYRNPAKLVKWAQPLLNDQHRFKELADPALQDRFPMEGLHQAVKIASMCFQDDAAARPLIEAVIGPQGWNQELFLEATEFQ